MVTVRNREELPTPGRAPRVRPSQIAGSAGSGRGSFEHGSRPFGAVVALALPVLLAASGCEIVAGISEIEDARDGGAKGCAAIDPEAGRGDCDDGLATCGGSAACAVSLASDPDNCGYCGHACGGPCSAGACEPAAIAADPSPQGLAVQGDTLFWASQGDGQAMPSIRQASIATGKLGKERKLESSPQSVAADATHVYWTYLYYKCIGRAPLDGGIAEDLGKCSGTNHGRLALDETSVYFVVRRDDPGCTDGDECCTTVAQTSCILKMNKGSGDVTTVAVTSADAYAVAVDGGHVYWGERDAMGASDGTVLRCPKSGCPGGGGVETVATVAGTVRDMQVDAEGGFVYWNDGSGGGVLRAPLGAAGGVAESVIHTVPASHFYGVSLTLDSSFVYWTDEDGRVYRASKQANQERFDDLGGSAAWGLASDCSHVYWSEQTPGAGRVVRVVR